MRKKSILLTLLLMSLGIHAQNDIKIIELKEGLDSNIRYNDLNISTLLQVHDKGSAAQLVRDIYLRVDHDGETIAGFNTDQTTKEYYTKIYKNYFLTFKIEKDKRYLIIEQAQFGKAFALSSNGSSTIGNKADSVRIEIVDFIHEWGYDAPPEDENRSYFSNVNYILKVKTKEEEKSFSFFSTEIKDDLVFSLENYSILILSDIYNDSSCFIEMIINKKE